VVAVILQCLVTGVSLGCVYALVGVAFMLVYSVTLVLNFAQGEFVMLGGMLTITFCGIGIPLFPAILLATLITALVGGFLYRVCIYPVRNQPVMVLILVTIAFALTVKGLALLAWGWQSKGLPPFMGVKPIQLGHVTIFAQTPWILGVTILTVAGLLVFLEYTIAGKACRACAIHPLGARLLGMSVERTQLLSFILAGALGAIAGAVITPLTMMSYDIGLPLAVKGYLAAIVGGLNRTLGVLIGGFAIAIIESVAAGVISSGYRDAIAYAIFITVLLYRPTGLIPAPGAGRV
jgi:branched-chain amino acid transport system permease protein